VEAVERQPRAGYRPAVATAVLGAMAAGLAAALVVSGPAGAQASADQVTITGIDLAAPLEVRAERQPELTAALYREVSWLVRREGDAPEPAEVDLLGPQYTLVVHIDGEPRYRFHLYPLAEAGPRVFRPVEQPGDRTVDEAWFYGRLSLPETISSAGVPLTGVAPPSAGGGSGGGAGPTAGPSPEARDMLAFLDEWREGMLLTIAALAAIVVGLAGAAYLIRRTV
jgi:hypothetical protein